MKPKDPNKNYSRMPAASPRGPTGSPHRFGGAGASSGAPLEPLRQLVEDLGHTSRGNISATRRIARPKYAPRQLLVKLKPDVLVRSHGAIEMGRPKAAMSVLQAVGRPFKYLEDMGIIEETVPVFVSAGPRETQVRTTKSAGALATSITADEEELRGITLVRLTHDKDVEAVMKALRGAPGIERVERVPARWPTSGPMRRGAPTVKRAPASTDARELWNLRAVGWYDASPVRNARSVRVSILDTGLDAGHPALAGTAYLHDLASDEDIVGHGTHVAGIVAATLNRRNRMQGLCACDLEVRKIFADEPDSDGEYYVDELMYLRALRGAQRAGAKVLNLSIGGTVSSEQERDVLALIISKGVTVVVAMGNEYEEGNPTEYPAAYPDVIAVGAIGENRQRASFSNTGSHIGLCAPGEGILSTLPRKRSSYRSETRYARWDGTSMAAPHVSAAAALLLASSSSLSPADVKKRLCNTTEKLPGMGGRARSNAYGAGLLNIRNLLS